MTIRLVLHNAFLVLSSFRPAHDYRFINRFFDDLSIPVNIGPYYVSARLRLLTMNNNMCVSQVDYYVDYYCSPVFFLYYK